MSTFIVEKPSESEEIEEEKKSDAEMQELLERQRLVNEIKTLHANVLAKDRELSQCLRYFAELEKKISEVDDEVEDAKE